jgi:hypothetical protein
MARTPSAMDVPFHPDIRFLAQCGRGLLRDPYQAEAHARRLSLRRRPTSRDQPFPRGAQSAIQTLHLDRRPRQNHRRGQARAPSVRFDPLARAVSNCVSQFCAVVAMASVLGSIRALNQIDLRGTRTSSKSDRRLVVLSGTGEECLIFGRFRLGSKHDRRPQTHYQFRRRISGNFHHDRRRRPLKPK